jgi:putative transposase
MARLVRLCPPGIPQHIIQRGNNRQICFAAEADFAAYAHWLHESAEKYGVAIHAWIFMTVRWQFPDDAESGASLCVYSDPKFV